MSGYDGFYGDLSSRGSANEALEQVLQIKEDVIVLKDETQALETQAQDHANEALQHAQDAENSAATAATISANVSDLVDQANQAAGSAQTAATASQASALNSATSATDAAESEAMALYYAQQAAEGSADTLRQDLAEDDGGLLVFNRSALPGAIKSSLASLWEQTVSLDATFGAIGDGTYHPLSERYSSVASAQFAYPGVPITSLTQSIDWAATYAAVLSGTPGVYVKGVYVLTDSIKINRSIRFFAQGYANDVNLDWKLSTGTFLAYGTGQKTRSVLGVTDGRASGGVTEANPDQRFILDSNYKLSGYYDDNADPILVSALFYGEYTSGIVFDNVMIALNFNGMDGYKNKTPGWGDDWDMGVYLNNCRYCTFRNTNIIGYWRKAGLMIRSGVLDVEPEYVASGVYAGAEENKFYNCVFQGWKSVSLRSIDMYKVLAVTSTYVEIPYSPSHPFKNHLRIRQGEFSGNFMTATSVSKVGDRLRFITVGSPIGKFVVGDVLAPAYHGNGVAGSVFQHCRMHGMNHTSLYTVSDTWHSSPMEPSACLEISGTRIRGMRFEGCKLQTIEDIGVHLHQCIDTIFLPNSRFEGSPDARGVSGIRGLTTNILYPHFVRESYRVQIQMEQSGIDFRPYVSEIPAKFPTAANLWNPTLFGFDAREGVFIGGLSDSNKLSIFSEGGFTMALTSSDGDLSTLGVVREAFVQRVGRLVNVLMSFYSGNPTFTAGNGQLRVNLPHPSGAVHPLYIPIMITGGAVGTKNTFIEISPGSTVGNLFRWGPDAGLQPLLVKDVTNSGQAVRFSGSFSYRT